MAKSEKEEMAARSGEERWGGGEKWRRWISRYML